MRLIGELSNEQHAKRFSAWLVTREIACMVERVNDSDQFEIWAKDEDKFVEARDEFAAFLKNPDDAQYQQAVQQAAQLEKQRQIQVKKYQKNIQPGVSSTQKGVFEVAPLTMVMVGICVVVALLTNFGSDESKDQAAARALQFVAVDSPSEELATAYIESFDSMSVRLASIYRGELWRLVSPIFIHYGAMHIVFNMLWLVYFGRMIEERYGTLRLFMIVIFTAIFSNVLQCTVPHAMGGSAPAFFLEKALMITRLGGMSGVNYGLFGFIWIRFLYDRSSGFHLSQFTIVLMLVYLVYCIISPGVSSLTGGEEGGSVANWAHGGGLVMGMLLALTPIGKTFRRIRK